MFKKYQTPKILLAILIATPLLVGNFTYVTPANAATPEVFAQAETTSSRSALPHSSETNLKETNPEEYARALEAAINSEAADTQSTEAGLISATALPPASPIDLRAFPATMTASDRFTVFWTNPSDADGIAAAYYKFDTPPTSNTDGTRIAPSNDPGDPTAGLIEDFSTGGRDITTMYVWLEDGVGDIDYTTNVSVILRPEGSMEGIIRVAGADRYETAAEISKKIFPVAKSADSVVIANGTRLADALAAVPLAFQANAPILLTKNNFIPQDTWNELIRVLPKGKKVYLAGGTAVIDAQQEKFYNDNGFSASRIAGATREVTSVKLTEKLDALRGTAPTSVYIANSRTLIDALTVGSPAAFQGRGILLTEPGDLTQNLRDYFNNNLATISEVTLMGGTAAIPASVAQLFTDAGYVVKRADGIDRYHTARIVADWFTGGTPASPAGIALVSNDGQADALPAAVHAAAQFYPIVLVRKDVSDFECLNTADFLQDNHAAIEGGYAYGGTSVLSEATRKSAQQMIAGTRDLACGNI